MKIKTSGKVLIIVLILGGIFCAKVFWWDKRPTTAKDSTEIGHLALPDAPEASLTGNATMLNFPTAEEAVNGGTKIHWEVMAWNAQLGLMYANGGAETTKGSLMDQNKLQVEIAR